MAEKSVADIMDADPATVGPDDDARTVIELLAKSELPAVPVVDGDGRVVGIVSENDLVISEEEEDLHLPHYFNLLGGTVFVQSTKEFEERMKKAFATKVSDLMTADPVTCGPSDDAHAVGRTIAEKHHNRLPVVDEQGMLVGVVSRADVLAALTAEG